MAAITKFAIALGLAATVAAQTTETATRTTTLRTSTGTRSTASVTGEVVSVYFPFDIDDQTLVGSLIGTANGVTTVAVNCPSGTDSNDCGFYDVTFTAGPTTFALTTTITESFQQTISCSFNTNSGGECTAVATGPISILATADDASTVTGTTTTTDSTTVEASEITQIPITITARAANLSSSAPANSTSTHTGSSSSGSGAPSASNPTSAGSSPSATTATTTRPTNAAQTLAPGMIGAGVLGLAAILL